MAAFLGLTSIVELLENDQGPHRHPQVLARRGGLEHTITILSMSSKFHLECVIANDDVPALKALLDAEMERMVELLPLHMAARAGSGQSVQFLLQRLPLAAITKMDGNDKGRTVFHAAAIGGSCEVMRALLSEEYHPEQANMLDHLDLNSETPLLLATRLGNADMARLLAILDEGRCLMIGDHEERTPMHHAVFSCPEVLLDFNTALPDAIKATDSHGATPLHIAARYGREMAVAALLRAAHESGCTHDVLHERDAAGRWPLHWAVDNGHIDIVETLLKMDMSTDDDEAKDQAVKLAVLAVQKGHLAILADLLAPRYPAIRSHYSFLLTRAAESGQLMMVEFLLGDDDSPASPDGDNGEEYTPLGYAAERGLTGIVRVLLQYGANINSGGPQKGTPLLIAAQHNQEGIVRLLLEQRTTQRDGKSHHININTPDPLSRNTPLHLAAGNGNVTIMGLLLSHPAGLMPDIEAQTDAQETPLHLAAAHPRAAAILLDAGANVGAEDIRRQTPLHKAIRCQNTETARLLIAKGASLSALDWEGHRPTYRAIMQMNTPLLQELLQEQYPREDLWDDVTKVMEQCNADPSAIDLYLEGFGLLARRAVELDQATDEDGQSLLHLVAKQGPAEFIDILINLGLDLNGLERRSRTPSFVTVLEGRSTVLDRLIKFQADLNKADEDGDTPLIIAAMDGKLAICEILLKAGALVNLQNHQGVTALYRACYYGYLDIVEALLRHNADPNMHLDLHWSPLHAASDNPDITALLLSKGADMDYQKRDLWTPMHLSACWGHGEVVRLLLEKGANPNQVTNEGETSLHLALSSSKTDVIQVMVKHRGQNAIDFEKRTKGLAPIHLAAQHEGGSESLALLLQIGQDVKCTTDNGQSCLDLALVAGNHETMKAILTARDSQGIEVSWNTQELSGIYWKAAEAACLECLSILTRKDHALVHQLSPTGLSALEVLVQRESGIDDEDESILFTLLACGFNPLRPSRQAGESAIELAAHSQQHALESFVSRCVKFCAEKHLISLESVGSQESAFRTLRVVTEFDEKNNWTALVSLTERAAIQDAADVDGWNINHFLYQSQPRQEYAQWRAVAVDQKTRTPRLLIRPPRWRGENPGLESRMQIHESGVKATFQNSHGAGSRHILALRADCPFPPREKGVAYFEIMIDRNQVDEPEHGEPIITIGFAGEFTNLRAAHCGWRGWSVGYHGDDGLIYAEQSQSEHALPTEEARTYGYNSTVGCGIDYGSGEYFFTLQGQLVFRKSSKVIYRKLYPCLSHEGSAAKVEVNFGARAFLWEGARTLAPQEEADEKVTEPEADDAGARAAMPPPSTPLLHMPPLRRRSMTSRFRSVERSSSRENGGGEVVWIREPSQERQARDSPVEDEERRRVRFERPRSVFFREPSPFGPRDSDEEAQSDQRRVLGQRPSRRRSSRRMLGDSW